MAISLNVEKVVGERMMVPWNQVEDGSLINKERSALGSSILFSFFVPVGKQLSWGT